MQAPVGDTTVTVFIAFCATVTCCPSPESETGNFIVSLWYLRVLLLWVVIAQPACFGT